MIYPPEGVGIYIRKILKSKHGTSRQAAKKAADHGISFVAILTIWQEKDRTKIINGNTSQLIEYMNSFYEEGIDVWIWGYPWCGKEREFIDRMYQILAFSDCRGIIIDPEIGYKVPKELATVHASMLCDGCINLLDENQYFGVTSYGHTNIHRTFPWNDFCYGFGSPQLYTCKTKRAIERGIRSWEDVGWNRIVPSVPAYGDNSAQNMERYLSWFPTDLQGIIVWSWRQISTLEWKTLERFSKTLE